MRLSYVEQGDSSAPAVVLLPGPTDSWRSYQPMLEHLPPSIRAVAVSQRGHGDSDKPATGYRVEDFAADVPRLLDDLAIERAVLVGHSGSCLVARRVAIDHPVRVAGLVLEASPTTLRDDARLASFVADLPDPIDPASARSFVVDTSSDEIAAEFVDVLVDEVLKVPAPVWRETFAGLLEYDDLDELERITSPPLLLWGDADEVVSREMQEQLVRRIPDAALHAYPGVGHTPRWEAPQRFAADVAAFVERLRRD